MSKKPNVRDVTPGPYPWPTDYDILDDHGNPMASVSASSPAEARKKFRAGETKAKVERQPESQAYESPRESKRNGSRHQMSSGTASMSSGGAGTSGRGSSFFVYLAVISGAGFAVYYQLMKAVSDSVFPSLAVFYGGALVVWLSVLLRPRALGAFVYISWHIYYLLWPVLAPLQLGSRSSVAGGIDRGDQFVCMLEGVIWFPHMAVFGPDLFSPGGGFFTIIAEIIGATFFLFLWFLFAGLPWVGVSFAMMAHLDRDG